MSTLLAVAARELRERWLLFAGGLALGFLPTVLPAFGLKRDESLFIGFLGAMCVGAAAALIIGSSMLARDAANGRLGFLFSRPASWPAIWGGKWLAALVLVVLSGLLTAVPWMVAFPMRTVGGHHGDSWLRAMLDGQGAALLLTAILIAVGAANFAATAFRSRSPWVAVDLVLLLAAVWATRRYIAPLWLYGVLRAQSRWEVVLPLAPLAIALLLGSMAQVAVGRTDVRRAHGALAVGFWAVAGLTLAAVAGYWGWIRSAGPADVNVHAVYPAPGGRWVDAEGSAERSGYYPHSFLIDTATGRYARLPESWDGSRYSVGLQFSADGRSAAILWGGSPNATLDLYDLAGEAPRVTGVVLESSPPPTATTAFALSPTSACVFVVHDSGASLFALPSGRRVATTTIPPGWRPALVRFPAESEARTWLVPAMELRRGDPHGPARAEMRVVDLATDGRSRTVSFPLAATVDPAWIWRGLVADAAGRRLLTSDGGVRLRDGATGEPIATLVEGDSRLPALFLADGRIVVGSGGSAANDPKATLLVFGADGTRVREVPLQLWPSGLSIGPEVAPGRVAVAAFRSPYLAEDTLVVDVGDGRMVERLSGLRPSVGFFVTPAVPADAAPTTVHFFRDVAGHVVRLDFATGERKIVAGRGAPRGERLGVR